MKISYPFNSWTALVEEDIKTLSDDQIKIIGRLIVRDMCVVFRNQQLTPEDELRICSVIGNFQNYGVGPAVASIRVNEGILRVTGQKNTDGEEGLFGHKAALDWHANQPSKVDRKPLIWLYGVSGTKGSQTSWINNIASYEGLSDELKDRIKDIKIYCGYEEGRYSTTKFFKPHVEKDNLINLVQTNKEGKTGLFFPFLQIFGFDGYSDSEFQSIMTELIAHVLKPEYAYHHHWEDNDIVISEQWLSIHKRWYFDKMEERVLHRIAFDYNNLYPSNDK